jgi:hypothetical protein
MAKTNETIKIELLNEITVTLDRGYWIEIARFLIGNLAHMDNITSVRLLTEELTDAGIEMEEIENDWG